MGAQSASAGLSSPPTVLRRLEGGDGGRGGVVECQTGQAGGSQEKSGLEREEWIVGGAPYQMRDLQSRWGKRRFRSGQARQTYKLNSQSCKLLHPATGPLRAWG